MDIGNFLELAFDRGSAFYHTDATRREVVEREELTARSSRDGKRRSGGEETRVLSAEEKSAAAAAALAAAASSSNPKPDDNHDPNDPHSYHNHPHHSPSDSHQLVMSTTEGNKLGIIQTQPLLIKSGSGQQQPQHDSSPIFASTSDFPTSSSTPAHLLLSTSSLEVVGSELLAKLQYYSSRAPRWSHFSGAGAPGVVATAQQSTELVATTPCAKGVPPLPLFTLTSPTAAAAAASSIISASASVDPQAPQPPSTTTHKRSRSSTTTLLSPWHGLDAEGFPLPPTKRSHRKRSKERRKESTSIDGSSSTHQRDMSVDALSSSPSDSFSSSSSSDTDPDTVDFTSEFRDSIMARRALTSRMREISDLARRKMQHQSKVAEFQEKQMKMKKMEEEKMREVALRNQQNGGTGGSTAISALEAELAKPFDYRSIFGITFPLLPFERSLLHDRYIAYREAQINTLELIREEREREKLEEWKKEQEYVKMAKERLGDEEPVDPEEIEKSRRDALASIIPLEKTLIPIPLPNINFAPVLRPQTPPQKSEMMKAMEAAANAASTANGTTSAASTDIISPSAPPTDPSLLLPKPITLSVPSKQLTPFSTQGDPNMYSDQSLDIRASLRSHPRILKVMDLFWRTFAEKDSKNGLIKKEYLGVHVKMQKAIVRDTTRAVNNGEQEKKKENAAVEEANKKPPSRSAKRGAVDATTTGSTAAATVSPSSVSTTSTQPLPQPTLSHLLTPVSSIPAPLKPATNNTTATTQTNSNTTTTTFDPTEAERLALRDWTRDTHRSGGSTSGLKLSQFQDALFELVDLWTETTDPREYVEFLSVLYQRVAKPNAQVQIQLMNNLGMMDRGSQNSSTAALPPAAATTTATTTTPATMDAISESTPTATSNDSNDKKLTSNKPPTSPTPGSQHRKNKASTSSVASSSAGITANTTATGTTSTASATVQPATIPGLGAPAAGRWRSLREVGYDGLSIEDIWQRFIEREKAREVLRLQKLLQEQEEKRLEEEEKIRIMLAQSKFVDAEVEESDSDNNEEKEESKEQTQLDPEAAYNEKIRKIHEKYNMLAKELPQAEGRDKDGNVIAGSAGSSNKSRRSSNGTSNNTEGGSGPNSKRASYRVARKSRSSKKLSSTSQSNSRSASKTNLALLTSGANGMHGGPSLFPNLTGLLSKHARASRQICVIDESSGQKVWIQIPKYEKIVELKEEKMRELLGIDEKGVIDAAAGGGGSSSTLHPSIHKSPSVAQMARLSEVLSREVKREAGLLGSDEEDDGIEMMPDISLTGTAASMNAPAQSPRNAKSGVTPDTSRSSSAIGGKRRASSSPKASRGGTGKKGGGKKRKKKGGKSGTTANSNETSSADASDTETDQSLIPTSLLPPPTFTALPSTFSKGSTVLSDAIEEGDEDYEWECVYEPVEIDEMGDVIYKKAMRRVKVGEGGEEGDEEEGDDEAEERRRRNRSSVGRSRRSSTSTKSSPGTPPRRAPVEPVQFDSNGNMILRSGGGGSMPRTPPTVGMMQAMAMSAAGSAIGSPSQVTSPTPTSKRRSLVVDRAPNGQSATSSATGVQVSVVPMDDIATNNSISNLAASLSQLNIIPPPPESTLERKSRRKQRRKLHKLHAIKQERRKERKLEREIEEEMKKQQELAERRARKEAGLSEADVASTAIIATVPSTKTSELIWQHLAREMALSQYTKSQFPRGVGGSGGGGKHLRTASNIVASSVIAAQQRVLEVQPLKERVASAESSATTSKYQFSQPTTPLSPPLSPGKTRPILPPSASATTPLPPNPTWDHLDSKLQHLVGVAKSVAEPIKEVKDEERKKEVVEKEMKEEEEKQNNNNQPDQSDSDSDDLPLASVGDISTDSSFETDATSTDYSSDENDKSSPKWIARSAHVSFSTASAVAQRKDRESATGRFANTGSSSRYARHMRSRSTIPTASDTEGFDGTDLLTNTQLGTLRESSAGGSGSNSGRTRSPYDQHPGSLRSRDGVFPSGHIFTGRRSSQDSSSGTHSPPAAAEDRIREYIVLKGTLLDTEHIERVKFESMSQDMMIRAKSRERTSREGGSREGGGGKRVEEEWKEAYSGTPSSFISHSSHQSNQKQQPGRPQSNALFRTSYDIAGRPASRDWMGRYYDELRQERGRDGGRSPDGGVSSRQQHQQPNSGHISHAPLFPPLVFPPASSIQHPSHGSHISIDLTQPHSNINNSNEEEMLQRLKMVTRMSAVKQSKLRSTAYLSSTQQQQHRSEDSVQQQQSHQQQPQAQTHRVRSPPRIVPAGDSLNGASTFRDHFPVPSLDQVELSSARNKSHSLSLPNTSRLHINTQSNPSPHQTAQISVDPLSPRIQRYLAGMNKIAQAQSWIAKQQHAIETRYRNSGGSGGGSAGTIYQQYDRNAKSQRQARPTHTQSQSTQYAGRTLAEILEQASKTNTKGR